MSVGPNCEDTVELPCPVGELKVSIRASPTASNGSFDSTSSYPSLLILLVPFLRGCLRQERRLRGAAPENCSGRHRVCRDPAFLDHGKLASEVVLLWAFRPEAKVLRHPPCK